MNAKNHRKMAKLHQRIADLMESEQAYYKESNKVYGLQSALDSMTQSRNEAVARIQRYQELHETQVQGYGRVIQLLDGLSDSQYIPVGTVRAAVEGTDLDTVEVGKSA